MEGGRFEREGFFEPPDGVSLLTVMLLPFLPSSGQADRRSSGVWKRRLRHMPTSPPTRRILNAKFIHPPKYLHLVVHAFTYQETCTCETHFIKCSCYLALGNLKMAYQKVIRDEKSAKRASESLLFCSFPNLYI